MSTDELVTRLTALSRLLVSEGHLTPAGARQIAKVLDDSSRSIPNPNRKDQP